MLGGRDDTKNLEEVNFDYESSDNSSLVSEDEDYM